MCSLFCFFFVACNTFWKSLKGRVNACDVLIGFKLCILLFSLPSGVFKITTNSFTILTTLWSTGYLGSKATVLEHNLGCAISQYVDAMELSSPTKQSQQWPIRISLTGVMPGSITRQASPECTQPIKGPESQASYPRVCITRQAIPEFNGRIP